MKKAILIFALLLSATVASAQTETLAPMTEEYSDTQVRLSNVGDECKAIDARTEADTETPEDMDFQAEFCG